MKKGQFAIWSIFGLGVVCGLIVANGTPDANAGNGNGIGKGGVPGLIEGLDDRLSAVEFDLDTLGAEVGDLSNRTAKLETSVVSLTKTTQVLQKSQNQTDLMILDILDQLDDLADCCDGGSGCKADMDCPKGTRCCPDGSCVDVRKSCPRPPKDPCENVKCQKGYHCCDGKCIPISHKCKTR